MSSQTCPEARAFACASSACACAGLFDRRSDGHDRQAELGLLQRDDADQPPRRRWLPRCLLRSGRRLKFPCPDVGSIISRSPELDPGRRDAAHPAGDADRLGAGGRPVRDGRANDRLHPRGDNERLDRRCTSQQQRQHGGDRRHDEPHPHPLGTDWALARGARAARWSTRATRGLLACERSQTADYGGPQADRAAGRARQAGKARIKHRRRSGKQPEGH